MPLTTQQSQQFEAWLKSKCSNLSCPGCAGSQFLTGELIEAPAVALGLGPRSIFLVVMPCATCGYCLVFSAGVVGLHGMSTP